MPVSDHVESGPLRRIGVGLLACALTVTIVGSAAFLIRDRAKKQNKYNSIQARVDQLEFLTAAEIAQRSEELRASPGDAAATITYSMRQLRRNPSAKLRLAIVRFIRPFVAEEPRLADRMLELRVQEDETLAAEAVASLGTLPPARAADYLTRTIDTPVCAAVMDVVCEELSRLGATGRTALATRMEKLSPQRRWWFVGYLIEHPPADLAEWMTLFANDPTREVKARAGGVLADIARGDRPPGETKP